MLRDKIVDILFSGGRTQREITSLTHSSRSRVSEVLGDLESEGFVTRTRVGGRTVVVSLNKERTLRVGILKSSEYFHVISALDSLGGRVLSRIRVYDNSLEALKSLVLGSEDIVASPLVSGYFFHLVDENVKPIAAVAKGGSGILRRKGSGLIGTTPLSSMDRESMSLGVYKRVYFKSVEDIVRAFNRGEIDAASVWEPFLSMNGGTAGKPDGVCCCIYSKDEATRAVQDFLLEYFSSILRGAECEGRPRICEKLASLLGVAKEDVERSLRSYVFTERVEREDAVEQIARFGFSVEKGVDSFLEKCPKVPL
ncbi:MAG: hypothetical protein ACP5UO_01580 [Thermoplasmata archaeon]